MSLARDSHKGPCSSCLLTQALLVLQTLFAIMSMLVCIELKLRSNSPTRPELVGDIAKLGEWQSDPKKFPEGTTNAWMVSNWCSGTPGIEGEPDVSKPFHMACESDDGIRWCDDSVVRGESK